MFFLSLSLSAYHLIKFNPLMMVLVFSAELTSLMGFTSVYRSLTQIFPQVKKKQS